MPGVNVTFGANIQPLVDGIGEVKSSIDSIADSARHLAEALGVALTIRGVEDFVGHMADLGSQTESVASRLGVSNEKVVELTGFAKLGGESIQELGAEIERMSLQAQRSTRDGVNPQAQAFKVLHINTGELIGQPADQWFLRVADAVSRFNPSLNLTNAVMAAGGRGVAALLPVLLQGKEHVAEFMAAWQAASEGLAAATPGMAATHEKLLLLSQSTQSFGARLFTVLKPAIDAVIERLTQFFESWKSEDLRGIANTVGAATISIAQSIALFFVDAEEAWRKFISAINAGMPALHAAAGGVLLTIGQIPLALEQFSEAAKGVGTAEPFAKIEADAEAARARINDLAKSSRDALAANVPKPGSTAALVQDFLQVQSAAQGAMTAMTRLNAAPINMGAGDALKSMEDMYKGLVKAADDAYKQVADKLAAQLKLHEITQTEETRQLLAALEVRNQAEQAAFDAELDRLPKGTAVWQQTLNARKAAYDKYVLDRQKVTEQASQAEAKEWKAAADQIAGAINGQLKQILSGHESLKQALMNISGQIVLKFIQDQVKVTIEWLANQARILAGHIAAETGMTAATTAGAAARTAAETASGQTSILATLAAAMKAIFASGGQTAAEVSASVAPEAGPAAPAIGLAAGTAVTTGSLAIAQMAVGGYVLREGLIYAHQGEVVPAAKVNMPYQGGGMGGGASGGGDTHVHIAALDSRSISRFFNDNAHHMIRALNKGIKGGAHLQFARS